MGNYLLRVKKTEKQKGLSSSERQNNLKKAFIIKKNDVKFKKVVLIDDIYTTGSTFEAATRVLLDAGMEKVYGITLSIGRDA